MKLYHVCPSTNHSLRDLIMEIRSEKYPDDPIFHSVDQPSNGSQVALFLHHPDDDAQAQQIKAGLLPYLRWSFRKRFKLTYPPFSQEENTFLQDTLYTYFTASTVAQAANEDWDEKEHCVTSKLAEELQSVLDGDDKFKFKVVNLDMHSVLMAAQTVAKKTDTYAALKAPGQYRKGTDDSISTLYGGRRGPATTPDAHKTMPTTANRQSENSLTSLASSASQNSGQTTITNNSNKSSRSSKSMAAMLEEIQKLTVQLSILTDKSVNQEKKLHVLSSQLLPSNFDHHTKPAPTKHPPVTPITLPPEARAEEES
jgi:hypothetical protein